MGKEERFGSGDRKVKIQALSRTPIVEAAFWFIMFLIVFNSENRTLLLLWFTVACNIFYFFWDI